MIGPGRGDQRRCDPARGPRWRPRPPCTRRCCQWPWCSFPSARRIGAALAWAGPRSRRRSATARAVGAAKTSASRGRMPACRWVGAASCAASSECPPLRGRSPRRASARAGAAPFGTEARTLASSRSAPSALRALAVGPGGLPAGTPRRRRPSGRRPAGSSFPLATLGSCGTAIQRSVSGWARAAPRPTPR